MYVLFLLLSLGGELGAQDRSNPFEITARLPQSTRVGDTTVAQGPPLTPFDIRRGPGTVNPSNSAPAAAQNLPRSGPLVIQTADPNKGKGAIVAIQLILLVGLASLWVLFGGLLRQCIRGTVNESLMNQLYTRRSGGEETALWICYSFYFLVIGFFLHLLTAHYSVGLGRNVWLSWLTYSLVAAAAVNLKQWVVWVVGRLFPVRKETSRYAFVLMVFSILAGIVFVPINLGVSYAPENLRVTFLYAGVAVAALLYFLHLTRGFFIIGPVAATRPVHLLLYICAIEIAPLLLFYRYLNSSLI
ncbi:DUF4271 domain-containing protein [Lewinella sp. 4G2]|uniref:DUF4271 domain-containing protein n=1 Tax=Lewinella sp. 4G2 TaxID=1803372 RepID=UPI0007B4DF8E|nr:DUF4271 domain-containing protein [Lewinella sp. 4G2]OAV43494.1 hypothetical protein A3850_002835 [Lewinella sp. 4G2]